MNEEENYQEPGPRTGKMSHISVTLGGVPKKLDPVDSQCQDCGSTFKATRFNVPVKVPKENYPRAFDVVWQERIYGDRCPACSEKQAEEARKDEEVAR